MKSRVEIKVDRVNQVISALDRLVGKEVLVGIPEENGRRRQDPITNAAIGYIHEFGAPASHIPPRPFLIPGVRKAAPAYLPHLRGAANAALDGKAPRAERELAAAGIVAEQGAKREIHSNIPPPLAPSTVRGRARQRQTQSRRPGEDRYLELVASGISPGEAQSQAGIVSLINTGQLAAAITSVVRKVK